MDPQPPHPLPRQHHAEGRGGGLAGVHRAWGAVGAGQQSAEERLAAGADEHREAQRLDRRQVGEQLPVVLPPLGEPESRVQDQPLGSYAGTYVSEELGTMVIAERDGVLHATIGDRSSPLVRIRGDAFYARWFPSDPPNPIVFTKESLKWGEWVFSNIRP